MRKKISGYKAILFDVDGTLYFQRGLRAAIAWDLIKYFCCHPLRFKELLILIKYRSVRENWEQIVASDTSLSVSAYDSPNMDQQQYRYVSEYLNTSPQQVEAVILYWIHRHPLALLPKYKDMQLAGLLAELHNHSIITAAYSDYPAAEKLAALNISADYIFCSSDENINCMKPDPKAMQSILHTLMLDSRDVLMIGDRYSKDGLAAKNAGMDFVILSKSIPARTIALNNLIL